MALGFDGGLTLALRATDLKRTVDWYRRVLGFEPFLEVKEIAWCELLTAVAKVSIGFSESETVGTDGGATPTWGVTDIAAAKAALEGHGVRLDGDILHIPGMVKLLTFYDPDGNALMLYETEGEGAPA